MLIVILSNDGWKMKWLPTWAFNEVRLVYIFQLLVLNDKHVLCPGLGDLVGVCLSLALRNQETWSTCLAAAYVSYFNHTVRLSLFIPFLKPSYCVGFPKLCLRCWLWIHTLGRQELERVWTSPYGSRSRRRSRVSLNPWRHHTEAL